MDEAEDGGRGGDPQGQGDDGDRRHHRGLRNHPQGLAELANRGTDHVAPPVVGMDRGGAGFGAARDTYAAGAELLHGWL